MVIKLAVELVTQKIIYSGDIIETFNYEKGYLKGYEIKESNNTQGRKKDFKSGDYESHRKQVLSRAKSTLRRLINSNHNQYGKHFTSKFLTLTFGENITDLDIAHYEFKKFILRLNYLIFNTKITNIKYNAVVEFQERGAIHYHVIIYNIPYTRQNVIQETWGNGYVWINKINHVDNVGAYITEYMGKDIQDDRLEGRKSYFSSRGLFKPIEITDKKIVDTVGAALPLNFLKHSSSFENEYLGKIDYKQFNLSSLSVL